MTEIIVEIIVKKDGNQYGRPSFPIIIIEELNLQKKFQTLDHFGELHMGHEVPVLAPVTMPFGRFLGYDRGEDGNLVINEEQAKTVEEMSFILLPDT